MSGVAVLNNISDLNAGTYNVSASFNGDANYNPSNENNTFSVDTKNTNIDITAKNINYGDNTSIMATLTDSDGSPLNNRIIDFSINGEW